MKYVEKLERQHNAWLKKTKNTGEASVSRRVWLRRLAKTFPPGWEGSNIIYHDDGTRTLTHPSGAVAHLNDKNIVAEIEGKQR